MLDYDNDGFARSVLRQRHDARRISVRRSEPTSHLYRNRGDGTFEDVTVTAGLALAGWGQGACAGDYDNDGFDDLYVTFWGQNRLFRNRGNGTFEDVTASAGLVTKTRWGAGCAFVDYDRDGLLDLFAANYIDFDLKTRAGAGVGTLPVQGRRRGLRPARTHRRQERAVPQHAAAAPSPMSPRPAGITQSHGHVWPRRQHARFRR